MPSRERVQALIELVERAQYVDAIREFYAEDATMQENQQPPREGLATLVANEQKTLASVKEIRGKAQSFVVDGDSVSINWVFDITTLEGHTRRLDEIAYQRWENDRIVRERFYYDPSQVRAGA